MRSLVRARVHPRLGYSWTIVIVNGGPPFLLVGSAQGGALATVLHDDPYCAKEKVVAGGYDSHLIKKLKQKQRCVPLGSGRPPMIETETELELYSRLEATKQLARIFSGNQPQKGIGTEP